MCKNKLFFLLLCIVIFYTATVPLAAAYELTTGRITVDDENITAIPIPKNAEYRFKASDFPDTTHIVLLELPGASSGSLSLGGSEIMLYDRIPKRQFEKLIFLPALGFTGNAAVVFRTEDDSPKNHIINLSYTEPDVLAPKAENISAETLKNISCYGTLKITENSNVEVVTPPRRGTLEVSGNNFVYSPNENITGTDSFDFVAVDENGLRGETATAVISINKSNSPGFSDIKETFAEYPVTKLFELGYLTGENINGERYFGPDENLSKAEYTMLIKSAVDNAANPSVTESIDGAQETAAVLKTGLIKGDENQNLRLDENISRADAAVIIASALEIAPIENGKFSDKLPAYAEKQINALEKAGIFYGYGDGTFRPENKITKAEAAVIAVRAMDYKKNLAAEAKSVFSLFKK